MASPPASSSALLLSSVLLLLILPAAARPCMTLFVSYAVSSTTYGVTSSGSTSAFEASHVAATVEQVPSRFFTMYRMFPLHYHSYASYSSSSAAASAEPGVIGLRLPIGNEHPIREELPFGGGSARERARDILIVVAGLLFGVGCGGLASVAIYLACSLINDRNEVRGSHGYGFVDGGDGDDGVESPKKMGYTHLPTLLATPVATLKEGHAGN